MYGKLSLKQKTTYGAAALGDSVIYCLINTYGLFFLTTIVEMPPATAGLVLAIGSFWNAIWNPMVGFVLDRAHSKYGKHRVFLFGSAPLLAIFCTLFFLEVEMNTFLQAVYYCIIMIAFWTVYSCYFIPYSTMGLEYTNDYNERVVLKFSMTIFNNFGIAAGMSLPTIMAKWLMGFGFSESRAWTLLALILSFIAFISIYITAIYSKKEDVPNGENAFEVPGLRNGTGLKDVLEEYVEIIKLPPMKWLVIMSVFGLIAYAFTMSGAIYYLTYFMDFTSEKISITLLLRPLYSCLTIVVAGKLILWLDKRGTMLSLALVGILAFMYVRFFGDNNTSTVLLYMLGFSLSAGLYWTLGASAYFDVSEYDLIMNGKNRRGAILSFQGLAECISSGIGAQLLGLILQFAGFDGSKAVQDAVTIEWIINSVTIIPSILMVLMVLAMWIYPLTRERYNKMIKTNGESERALLKK